MSGDKGFMVRAYCVQWLGQSGWWIWSGHKHRSQAWKEMRRARETYAKTTAEKRGFRVVRYMPEAQP